MTSATACAAPRLRDRSDRVVLVDDADQLVAAATGRPPRDLDVEVLAVHDRPGVGVSVVYRVTVDGEPQQLVASTAAPRREDRSEGVVTLEDGTRTVRVWWQQDDPSLPGLRHSLNPAVVARWLGLTAPPTLTRLTYRPTRRAVVRVDHDGVRLFVKVVRPDRVEALRRRHELCDAAPALLGEPEPGVLMLAPAEGTSLAHAFASGDHAQIPDPREIVGLLRSLPDAALTLPRREAWSERSDFHANAAARELPARASEIGALETRLRGLIDERPAGAVVPTHGDVNVANLFVADGNPTGLIDVDSLGPGHLVDDLATLLAHVLVLEPLAPALYAHVPQVARSWARVFEGAVDPVALRARTAAVALSLIAGAGTTQAQHRLDLALTMAEHAEEAR